MYKSESKDVSMRIKLTDTDLHVREWIDGCCTSNSEAIVIRDELLDGSKTQSVVVECLVFFEDGTKNPLTKTSFTGDEWIGHEAQGELKDVLSDLLETAKSVMLYDQSNNDEDYENPTLEEQTLYVHAVANVPAHILQDEDGAVEGVYAVHLKRGVPKDGLANAALDGFHTQVSVAVLDDFEITVCKGEDPLSDELDQSDEFENSELVHFVISVNRMPSVAPSEALVAEKM